MTLQIGFSTLWFIHKALKHRATKRCNPLFLPSAAALAPMWGNSIYVQKFLAQSWKKLLSEAYSIFKWLNHLCYSTAFETLWKQLLKILMTVWKNCALRSPQFAPQHSVGNQGCHLRDSFSILPKGFDAVTQTIKIMKCRSSRIIKASVSFFCSCDDLTFPL